MGKLPEVEIGANHGQGLSLLTATVFIVGEVAGGGILSLPNATAHAGWSGLALIIYCATCAGISGLCLAEAWIILEERYPIYRHGLTRKPFATIGQHAFGPLMSGLVSVLMNVTRIGATSVFLLLTAQMVSAVTESFIDFAFCNWILVVAAILLVPLWLGSPADFWPIAYSTMISTVIGSILLIIDICLNMSKYGSNPDYHFDGFESFASAFGTILFAFGGASAFPNFQNDMREKEKFPKAVIFGFIGLILLYVPTAALGYAAFGFEVKDNVLENLHKDAFIIIIEICFLVHCLTVVLIVINPVYLDLEELCRIPKPFNWKRCVFRTFIFVIVVFIGETFPSFGQILDLIGSSTITLMAFVLPPIFYIKLCHDRSNDQWPKRHVPFYLYVILTIIVISGIVGGIASTYFTLKKWSPLSSACYVSNANITRSVITAH